MTVPQTGHVSIAHNINKTELVPSEAIPLTISQKQPRLYLNYSCRMAPDEANKHLMTVSSVIGLSLDAEMNEELLHYDYERDKLLYPEAHLQIEATSPSWEKLASYGRKRPLPRLHLPIGSRRFRVTLEDVIEFLYCESLCEFRTDWKQHVEAGRQGFYEKQLRAAIRRYPDIARQALEAIEKP